MSPFRIRLLYLAYALAAVLLFLYVLFPSEDFKKALMNRVENANLGYNIRIETLKPAIPPGIQLASVRILREDQTIGLIRKLTLKPEWFGLVIGQHPILFSGMAYDGSFNGKVNFTQNDWSHIENLNISLNRIRIKDSALSFIEGAPVLNGLLSGSAAYAVSQKSGDNSESTLTLTEATLTLPILQPEFAAVAFEKVNMTFSIEKQSVNFRELLFSGPQIEGSLAGTVRVEDPVIKSRLDLRVSLSIRSEFRNKISQIFPIVLMPHGNGEKDEYKFKIFGILEKPGFSITR
jgi:type II secretion system protein N